LARNLEIGSAILVAIRMTADDDRLRPAGHEPRHVLANDRLPEDDAAEDVADGTVRRPPHLLEAGFFHSRLVRGNGRALDADADPLDRLGGLHSDAILGLVAVLDAEVIIKKLDVEIGMD